MKKIAAIILFLVACYQTIQGQILSQQTTISNLEEAIKIAENKVENIKPNNEAKIIWAKGFKEKQSNIAFVYLHGFGASHREGEPIMTQLSEKYQANVFMSRLEEHGINRGDSFKNLTPENYIASAKEALQIGKMLGKQIILVSTSTGGTLSLHLASEDESIAGLILYSPCIGLKNPAFAAILSTEGKAGFIKMNGSEIMKQKRDEEEAKYWSTSYHIDGYVALIKMLTTTMTPQTFAKVKAPVFMGYYYKNEQEQDQVVSVPAMLKMVDALGTAADKKEKMAFPETGNHVIACDLRSNDWKNVYQLTLNFMDEIILNKKPQFDFELQGHRGARGLQPENTLPGFKKAIELGVNTIELDVVISKDKKVVVSHEPWFNHEITLDVKGNSITKEVGFAFNFYKNDYQSIKKYDVGAIGHPNFPEQEKVKAYKPLLSEVIDFAEAKNPKILYNIEIKSTPTEEAKGYQPAVNEFCDLVVAILKKSKLPIERVVIQSFDPRVLEYIHKTHPEYYLAFLTYQNNMETNLKMLSFMPQIYSPYFILMSDKEVENCHQKNMKVIPWTVNKIEDMIRLLKMGVDGLITDYPNIAIPLRK